MIGFDEQGHLLRLPNRPEDDPILIHSDRWYAVEVMTHYTSTNINVTKLWVASVRQIE